MLATKVSSNISGSHSFMSAQQHCPFTGSWLELPQGSSSLLNPAVCDDSWGSCVLLQVAGYGTHNTYLRSPERTVRVTPDQIVESVDASLKRLGTDYIDLLQVRTTTSEHLLWNTRQAGNRHTTAQRSMARHSTA